MNQRDKNGDRDGEWKLFWSNGKLQLIINYKNGICHGVRIAYYGSGIRSQKSVYKNGEEIGLCELYNSLGEVIVQEYLI